MRLIDADALDDVVQDLNDNKNYGITRGEYKLIDAVLFEFPTIEPEQTYCDYCHEDNDGFVWPIEKNSHAVIHGSVLHLKAKGWSGKVQIKYCPMCGRRLER